MKKEDFREVFAAAIVLGLLSFLLFGAYKFANGFFGGILLYIVLLPVYTFLRKRLGKNVSAGIVILLALFAIIVPLLAILGIAGTQLFGLIQNKELLADISSAVSDTISSIFPTLEKSIIHEQLVNLGGLTSSLLLDTVVNIGNFLINLSIALFILYYLIIQEDLFSKIKRVIPFHEKHSQELVDNLKNVSYSVVFVSGIIALVQGSLLTITFLIFGINNAFLWGFVAAVLSFLPIVGPPIVWFPAVVIQFFQGNYKIALGVFISGLIISNIDNFLRPVLGRKISNVHPLTTILGIFIGIMLFGMIGIFVGPLLVSLSVLVLRMFKEEYYK